MLVRIYKYLPGRLRRWMDKLMKRYDGGEFFSIRLRAVYKKVYNVEVGIGSYGCFNVEQFPAGTVVGNYCSIGPRVVYLFSNHPMHFASTHPMFYNAHLGYVQSDRIERQSITLGHDVWIGADVVITNGCTRIGNGAVIGAGSVVTHDVAPYNIVAGNPAKLIRTRFTQEEQAALESCGWFELAPGKLAECMKYVDEPLVFARNVRDLRERLAAE